MMSPAMIVTIVEMVWVSCSEPTSIPIIGKICDAKRTNTEAIVVDMTLLITVNNWFDL